MHKIDYDLPWCTYETTHPSGLRYRGKAQTLMRKKVRYFGPSRLA